MAKHPSPSLAVIDPPQWIIASRATIITLGFVAVSGCVPPPMRMPPDPLPMSEASALVNANIARISGALRAVGNVDGTITTAPGKTRNFHVDGTLFYLAPSFVRFDLKYFGDRQYLFGSNAQSYWAYSKAEDRYECGRHGQPSDLHASLPVHPRQIIAALGLSALPRDSRGALRVQRVVAEHQQILFLETGPNGRVRIRKEYWLDRFPPNLIRRVIFRDVFGAMEMESHLDDYRRMGPDGPMLPRTMVAQWPGSGATLRFRINRWKPVPQVGPDAIQFQTPRECAASTGSQD